MDVGELRVLSHISSTLLFAAQHQGNLPSIAQAVRQRSGLLVSCKIYGRSTRTIRALLKSRPRVGRISQSNPHQNVY
jgi:hypothetical protein